MQENIYLLIGLSLGLGLLVGLQREHSSSGIAGIRTFPLITLTGTICGILAKEYDSWIIAAGFVAMASMLVIGNIQRIRKKEEGTGITTEIAALLMFSIGIYLVFGSSIVAVVLTGITTILLHFKMALHGWVDRIGEQDLRSVMQFVLISMVILPVLPNTTYDPFQALNPRNIWLMVVLIVGISLTGYFLYKFIRGRAGVLIGGILGGIISSTATTASYSRMAAKTGFLPGLAAFVIITASAISLVRVIIEIFIVAPATSRYFILPLVVEFLILAVLTAILYIRYKDQKKEMPEQENPAQLKGAIIFAFLYAAVSLLSAIAREKFGEQGLYVVSVMSGLTDLDAITLSTARMTEAKSVEPSLGWRLILVAAMSNLLFKAGMALFLGNRVLGRTVALLFAVAIAGGLVLLFFWPDK